MLASGSGAPVMVATLAVGTVIVIAAFIARRILLRSEESLPRRPSELFALAFGKTNAPLDPEATCPRHSQNPRAPTSDSRVAQAPSGIGPRRSISRSERLGMWALRKVRHRGGTKDPQFQGSCGLPPREPFSRLSARGRRTAP